MLWQKIRSGIAVTISLLTCPCHLPVTMPLILILLAGTPSAIWLTQHVSLIYGILTGVFLLSLTLGLLWSSQPNEKAGEICEPHTGRAIQVASTTKEYNK